MTRTLNDTPRSYSAPPMIPGLPLVGNARDFLNRPMEFFLEAYREYGSIFRHQSIQRGS